MLSPRLLYSTLQTLAGLNYVAALATPPGAQTPLGLSSSDGKAISPELYDTISTILRNNTVPGYSLAVVHPEAEVEFGTWGNRTEDGDRVTSNTLFTLASVSKAITATAVGIVMDDFAHGHNLTALPDGVSEFTWNTKVKDLLPDAWELMDPWALSKASIRDILSHTSGLPRHDFSYGPDDSTSDILLRMRHLRPAYELREKFHYNNQMYMLATNLVARYSGLPYQTFVASRIFTPLNMVRSTYYPSNASATGDFTQSWMSTGRRIPHVFDDALVELNSGPGGVISNAVDMARWVRFLLGAEDSGAPGIPMAVVREVMKPHALVPGEPMEGYGLTAYGMGWFVTTFRGHRMIHHGGSIPGISTFVALFPDDGLGIVQFANADSKGGMNSQILRRVVEAALGLPRGPEAVVPAKSLNKSLVPSAEPRDGSPSPRALPLDAFSGTYANAGYGSFTLCAPASTSHHCSRVLSAFDAIDTTKPYASATSKEVLYVAWPRIGTSHFRVVRLNEGGDGNAFSMQPTNLYPKGYGKDKTPFETALDGVNPEGATVQFVVEGDEVIGFGLTSLIGEVTERERLGSTVEEKAEVWFRKI